MNYEFPNPDHCSIFLFSKNLSNPAPCPLGEILKIMAEWIQWNNPDHA
jgi:hypothetical protein